MKRVLMALFACALLSLAACSHVRCETFRILASTFPVYQFTANLCANAADVQLSLLVPAAAGCPHDLALKPADIQKLATTDVLVINGAGLEEFLAKPLAGLEKRPQIIDAGANVPVLDDGVSDHVNTHIFASPENARLMVANIASRLEALNPQNAEIYAKNAESYSARLEQLSKRFKSIGPKAKNRGIALEHDALAYLAANAGLDIVAIFENALSANRLAKLELMLVAKKPALLAGDAQYPDRLLKTLAKETGIPFTQLNPCSSGPVNAGPDYYLNVMQKNLELMEKFFAPSEEL